jgi:hypothetical protein
MRYRNFGGGQFDFATCGVCWPDLLWLAIDYLGCSAQRRMFLMDVETNLQAKVKIINFACIK